MDVDGGLAKRRVAAPVRHYGSTAKQRKDRHRHNSTPTPRYAKNTTTATKQIITTIQRTKYGVPVAVTTDKQLSEYTASSTSEGTCSEFEWREEPQQPRKKLRTNNLLSTKKIKTTKESSFRVPLKQPLDIIVIKNKSLSRNLREDILSSQSEEPSFDNITSPNCDKNEERSTDSFVLSSAKRTTMDYSFTDTTTETENNPYFRPRKAVKHNRIILSSSSSSSPSLSSSSSRSDSNMPQVLDYPSSSSQQTDLGRPCRYSSSSSSQKHSNYYTTPEDRESIIGDSSSNGTEGSSSDECVSFSPLHEKKDGQNLTKQQLCETKSTTSSLEEDKMFWISTKIRNALSLLKRMMNNPRRCTLTALSNNYQIMNEALETKVKTFDEVTEIALGPISFIVDTLILSLQTGCSLYFRENNKFNPMLLHHCIFFYSSQLFVLSINNDESNNIGSYMQELIFIQKLVRNAKIIAFCKNSDENNKAENVCVTTVLSNPAIIAILIKLIALGDSNKSLALQAIACLMHVISDPSRLKKIAMNCCYYGVILKEEYSLRVSILNIASKLMNIDYYPLKELLLLFLLRIRSCVHSLTSQQQQSSEEEAFDPFTFIDEITTALPSAFEVRADLLSLVHGASSNVLDNETVFCKWAREGFLMEQAAVLKQEKHEQDSNSNCISFKCEGIYMPNPTTGQLGVRLSDKIQFLDLNKSSITFTIFSPRSSTNENMIVSAASASTTSHGMRYERSHFVDIPLSLTRASFQNREKSTCSSIFEVLVSSQDAQIKILVDKDYFHCSGLADIAVVSNSTIELERAATSSSREPGHYCVQFFIRRNQFDLFIKILKSRCSSVSFKDESSDEGQESSSCSVSTNAMETRASYWFRDNSVELNTKFVWESVIAADSSPINC